MINGQAPDHTTRTRFTSAFKRAPKPEKKPEAQENFIAVNPIMPPSLTSKKFFDQRSTKIPFREVASMPINPSFSQRVIPDSDEESDAEVQPSTLRPDKSAPRSKQSKSGAKAVGTKSSSQSSSLGARSGGKANDPSLRSKSPRKTGH